MEGLGHGFVVAPGELPHEVLVEVVADSVNSMDGGLKLILFLLSDIQYPIRVPSPLSLHNVPHLLYRVELTTLWWQELMDEPSVVELLGDNLAVVDR